MKISCLIVDDEPLAIRVLKKYVRRVPHLELAGSCGDAIEAGEFLQNQPVDLLLLDIHMPGLSGISFLKTLSDPPLVIFTTAYPEYAVEGFELEAQDFLVKPIAFERFLKAINKATQYLETRRRLEHLDNAPLPQHLLVKADRKLYKIDYEDLLYFQAYGDYVKIVTREGTIAPKMTLKEMEEKLPASLFVQVHRSYIVALDAIQYIEGNHLHIRQTIIPIGQHYREGLLSKLEAR
jgi:DNA-binding LytR/AlgR family response regulator